MAAIGDLGLQVAPVDPVGHLLRPGLPVRVASGVAAATVRVVADADFDVFFTESEATASLTVLDYYVREL